MNQTPQMTLAGIVLDSPDARVLAAFYHRLLGWEVEQDEPDWVKLTAPDGGPGLSFQSEANYTPPTWPTSSGDQQMMLHLDIGVDDLEAAADHAVTVGAVLAEHQPQAALRVCLDPAGHPFCLFSRG